MVRMMGRIPGPHRRRGVTVLLLLAALALFGLPLGSAPAQAHRPAPTAPDPPAAGHGRPLANLLNPDGTVNLHTGYSGTVDPAAPQARAAARPAQPASGAAGAAKRPLADLLKPDGTVNLGTSTSTANPCDTAWAVVASANQSIYNNTLNAIAVVNSSDVWAVGYYHTSSGGQQTLTEHWNGTAWTVVPSPNLGSNSIVLTGVAVVTSTDVWAVGYSDGQQTLTEHWNGTAWAVVPSPNPSTGNNELYGVAVVNSSDVWAVGSYDTSSGSQTLTEHWNGTAWTVVPSPNRGSSNNGLTGVAVVNSTDVWAVGYYQNDSGSQTLTEHWNGTAWTVVASANPSTHNNPLTGVAVVTSSDVWAVGYYQDDSGPQTLTEHWNGTAWAVVPSPNRGSSSIVLTGVAVVTSSDVWAVGDNRNGSGVDQTLTEHWNGTAWAVVPSPNRGTSTNELYGVAVVNSSDVWAVGYYDSGQQGLTEHYSDPCVTPTPTATRTSTATPNPCGTAWTAAASPNPSTGNNTLNAMAVVNSSDVWAVGSHLNGSGFNQTLTEHWNGTAWAVVPSPNPRAIYSSLQGVAVVTSSDVWAVGYYQKGSGDYQTLIEHWNGTAWTVVPSPNRGSSSVVLTGLNAVAVVNSSDVWAVGSYQNGSGVIQTLTEHWNGTAWAVVPSPNRGSSSVVLTGLNGVAVVNSSDVWAVGSYLNGSGFNQTLTEHWNGTAWAVVPSPNPRAIYSSLQGVAVVTSSDVWAVGYYQKGSGDYQTLIEHWNGSAWSVVASPNRGSSSVVLTGLTGVAVVNSSDVWAVGSYQKGSGVIQTLTEHWNGTAWAVVASPNPGIGGRSLNAVAVVNSSDVWAVGYYDSGFIRTLTEHYSDSCLTPTPGMPGAPAPGMPATGESTAGLLGFGLILGLLAVVAGALVRRGGPGRRLASLRFPLK